MKSATTILFSFLLLSSFSATPVVAEQRLTGFHSIYQNPISYIASLMMTYPLALATVRGIEAFMEDVNGETLGYLGYGLASFSAGSILGLCTHLAAKNEVAQENLYTAFFGHSMMCSLSSALTIYLLNSCLEKRLYKKRIQLLREDD